MDLIVDTNILWGFFWKGSFARKVLQKLDFQLFAPSFALQEIEMHKEELWKRRRLTLKEFQTIKKELKIAVTFVEEGFYAPFLKKAALFSPDEKDVDFFALAMKMDLPLWSNDAKLKAQDKVLVINSFDLIEHKESIDIC